MKVESAVQVASRIRRALPFVAARNIIVCTDCGMKYLPREAAFGKMKAMVEGASIVQEELSQRGGKTQAPLNIDSVLRR
jgi:5-methyltetrahydropteroyltriglutamate--homocysteine methyltransferase